MATDAVAARYEGSRQSAVEAYNAFTTMCLITRSLPGGVVCVNVLLLDDIVGKLFHGIAGLGERHDPRCVLWFLSQQLIEEFTRVLADSHESAVLRFKVVGKSLHVATELVAFALLPQDPGTIFTILCRDFLIGRARMLAVFESHAWLLQLEPD